VGDSVVLTSSESAVQKATAISFATLCFAVIAGWIMLLMAGIAELITLL
jgi:hypothetical protein